MPQRTRGDLLPNKTTIQPEKQAEGTLNRCLGRVHRRRWQATAKSDTLFGSHSDAGDRLAIVIDSGNFVSSGRQFQRVFPFGLPCDHEFELGLINPLPGPEGFTIRQDCEILLDDKCRILGPFPRPNRAPTCRGLRMKEGNKD